LDRQRLQEAINLDRQISDLKAQASKVRQMSITELKSYLSQAAYNQITQIISDDISATIAQREQDFADIPATAPAVRVP